ncbi:AAA domain-domain-containing protein [Catenaria anguillulae PL171]|uniref:AAA domain-domain-containing protein n=1 Tax=Catenaria anguillulae PL171 TaxID=765915 RepID=A0A1Y2HMP9_9FUNG|nr:AAA domain-domain-containing protein [Catenaria anguillulae PL171]
MYLLHNLVLSHGNINFCSRIGIITMYKEQMRLIRQRVLKAYGQGALDFVDVNTVDGFQGQEKDVIIMSTVRADPVSRPAAGGPGASKSKSIGFLSDMRRMNVALTRAKYSLFIVGSAKTLVVNQYWRELIEHARETGVLCELSNVPQVTGPCPKNLQPPDYEVRISEDTQGTARPAASGARKQVLPPRPPPPTRPPMARLPAANRVPGAPPVAASAIKRTRNEGESGNLSLSAAVTSSFGVGGPAGVGIVRLGPSKRANAGNVGRKS